jgi:hypothetical protein
MSVAIEDVYDEFGYGEAHPEAVKAFLEYAFHSWERAPRYVVLLGDATYDFKNSLGTGTLNRVPPIIIRDTYLWTVSDPEYAFVNGSDLLPDFALGRLPGGERRRGGAASSSSCSTGRTSATTCRAAPSSSPTTRTRRETSRATADRLAQTFLADRSVEKDLPEPARLGHALRRSRTAFDTGASLMTYIGHGGTAVWASENIWNFSDVRAPRAAGSAALPDDDGLPERLLPPPAHELAERGAA